MGVGWILLAFGGVIVAVNVLVVALCAVASRSDAAMERYRASRGREVGCPGCEGAGQGREDAEALHGAAQEASPVAHANARRD